MKFKFQTYVDVSTSASSMQVLQWSVGGGTVLNRCRHLFGAYKYFKLGKISVKMVPASTLPVDPLGLSYATDDPQTVDPRDQMNPGLVRITNGEDVFTDIASLNATQQENMYKTMMLDPRWSKFMLQSGFRRTAYPLYWQVGQLSQDKYPGATINIPVVNGADASNQLGVDTLRLAGNSASTHALIQKSQWLNSSPIGLFQTGHRGKLGFLPTDFYQQIVDKDGNLDNQWGMNNIPEVKVITCVLPKAYKTVYYYRIFITEEVIFAGLRSAPYINNSGQMALGIDNFTMGTFSTVQPGQLMPNITPSMNNGDGQK